jgi:hypothetical protein
MPVSDYKYAVVEGIRCWRFSFASVSAERKADADSTIGIQAMISSDECKQCRI